MVVAVTGTTVNWQTGVDGGQGVTEQGKRKRVAIKWYGGVLYVYR